MLGCSTRFLLKWSSSRKRLKCNILTEAAPDVLLPFSLHAVRLCCAQPCKLINEYQHIFFPKKAAFLFGLQPANCIGVTDKLFPSTWWRHIKTNVICSEHKTRPTRRHVRATRQIHTSVYDIDKARRTRRRPLTFVHSRGLLIGCYCLLAAAWTVLCAPRTSESSVDQHEENCF